MNSNPLRGPNRLKLGAFNFNGDGNARTLSPDAYEFNWQNSLDVAQAADRIGFEAIVPYARYRSVVGPRHRSAHVFDTLTWCSAIAAHTTHSGVMSTLHVANFHPLVAAKAMATIDHVSGGRFALNLVCGWFKEEAEMFGNPFLDHDERYAYADEWITAIKRLWSEEETFDFEGRYITIRGGMSQPKPLQQPRPLIMNAGNSPAARSFVGRHCDIAFISAETTDQMRKAAEEYRKVAREEHGREIQVWLYCAIVQGDTTAEAMATADRYAEMADSAYISTFLQHQTPGITAEQAAAMKRRFAISGNGHLLVGDADRLAADLSEISQAGVDGVVLTWVDFQSGVRRFGAEVLPKLEAAGLRSPMPVT